MPGGGQLFQGRPTAALLWFAAVASAYWRLPVLGAALHLLCALNAYGWDIEHRHGETNLEAPPAIVRTQGRCTACGTPLVVDAYSCANCGAVEAGPLAEL
ncbi:MAG TPA: hypothetical protein VMZ90_05005 [Vicinamibacterales bacterium]|nr:hypothetical protein [Vicinamibacterales bacterium]